MSRGKIHKHHNYQTKNAVDLGNIFLIGPMGTGKTTIGRQLAKHLSCEFYDSDKEIEARTGVDIPVIFEYEGEVGFRRREREVVDDLTSLYPIVLATGGGIVLDPENCALLKANGTVIYLKCNLDRLVERTSKDTRRPLLQTANPRQKLAEILTHRDPIYRATADYIVDTSRCSTNGVIREIIRLIRRRQRGISGHHG